jgi:hypothetical protein
VGPDQGNTWHRGTIRLTPSRLVAVAGSGRAPASGGDGTAAARLRLHGFRRGPRRRTRGRTDSGEARGGAAQCVAWEAQVMSREGLGTFAWR